MAESQVIKKKKKWFSIVSDKEFNNLEVGETLASEGTSLIGRTIEVNLANITQDPKSQNIKIKFKVREMKDNQAHANVISYEMLSTYVKRVVKPAKEKVEDSFEYATKDNANIKIKTIFLTKAKTIKSVLSNLRNQSREFLLDYCKKSDYKTLINDLASHNLQRDLKNVLSFKCL